MSLVSTEIGGGKQQKIVGQAKTKGLQLCGYYYNMSYWEAHECVPSMAVGERPTSECGHKADVRGGGLLEFRA
jgi:hypothetical protein